MKDLEGPFDPKEKCTCTYPRVVSFHDYITGWGRRICSDCKRHYKWGVA